LKAEAIFRARLEQSELTPAGLKALLIDYLEDEDEADRLATQYALQLMARAEKYASIQSHTVDGRLHT
jgi:hypothetical protein